MNPEAKQEEVLPAQKDAEDAETEVLVVDPEVLAWEKSLSRFNVDTDILIIPENDDEFVEKSLTSVIVMTAVDLASAAGVLITIEGLRRPALIRSWARSGSSELL